MRILQILPRLPPSICGVGDYSLALARAWQTHHEVSSRFIVVDPLWKSGEGGVGFEVTALHRHSAGELVRLLVGDARGVPGIILQFSGYGFSKRGVPLWLLRALRRVRRQLPHVPLLTMFHELYAVGSFPSSAFWLGGLQRRIARSLARLSHCVRTSGEVWAARLTREMGIDPSRMVTLPIFSNFGESAVRTPLEQRENNLVVFSTNIGSREHVPTFWEELSTSCHSLGADAIRIIGRPLKPPELHGIRLEQTGILDADEASHLLANSRFAYLEYNPTVLAKSGLFAALAAHGVVTIVPGATMGLNDGLQAGKHCLERMDRGTDRSLQEHDRISDQVFQWYQPHSIAATAASFLEQLRSVT